MLFFVEYLIFVLYVNRKIPGYGDTSYSSLAHFNELWSRLDDWGTLLDKIGLVFLWLALVDTGLGMLFCWKKAAAIRPIVRIVAYGLGGVLVLLAFVGFGKYEEFYTRYFKWYRSRDTEDYESYRSWASDRPMDNMRPFDLLSVAYDFILWIAVLATTGLAALTAHLARRTREHIQVRDTSPADVGGNSQLTASPHEQTAFLVLAACIFLIIRTAWSVAGDIRWTIPIKYVHYPTTTLVLDAVLGDWTTVLALMLLFAAGARKAGGLWSTAQSWPSSKQQYYHATQPVMAQPPQHYGR